MKYLNVLRGRAFYKKALLGAATASLLYTPSFAQSDDEGDDEEVKTYTVTGSRIRRIDLETPSPVLVISREELDSTGFATVGDALRALPIVNGQSLNSTDSGTSFTPGVNTVNLRGLGNNNTLSLINGRRAALYPSPGFNGFQSVFDYNSIPVSAIESIEIQKDGASAIYGSDAVAGVINIELRKDFEGLQTQISFGDTFDTGSFEKKFFAIAGTSTERTSIVYTVDFAERNAIFNRDLDYTDDADATDIGGDDNRSAAPAVGQILYQPDLVDKDGNPVPAYMVPNGGLPIPYGTYPTVDDFEYNYYLYNYQQNAGLFPESKYLGFYTYITHEVTDTVTAFAEASFRRVEMSSHSAPTPVYAWNEQGDSYYGGLNMPTTNPYNPFGVDVTELAWRVTEAGNRENDLVIDYPRMVAGLEGEIGFDWTWETSVAYSKSLLTNQNKNSIQDQLLQDALNGVEIDGEVLYANPWGSNDPRVIDYFTIDNPNQDSYEVLILGANASGVLADLPAGPLGIAFGTEYREDHLENIGTSLNETGQIVGGSEGTNTFGDRDVTAAYAELSVPVLENLEFQLAARYEDYSDFGEITKPKIAFKYRPTNWLLFRSSYGESYRAPDLPYLYAAQSTSFSSSPIRDPKRPDDANQQIRMITGGNPLLEAEETDVIYAGAIISPEDVKILKDFTFSFEYFKFDQASLIDSLSAAEALDLEDVIPGLVVRNPPGQGETYGTISYVNTAYQNIDSAALEGYDIGVKWIKETDSYGDFRVSVDATFTDSYTLEGIEYAGTDNYPEWRGTTRFAWSKNDWGASMYVVYVDEYPSRYDDLPATEAQWLFNPQISYSGLYDTQITFGVRNVFNSEPPRDKDETLTVNPSVNSLEPGFWYLRLTRDF